VSMSACQSLAALQPRGVLTLTCQFQSRCANVGDSCSRVMSAVWRDSYNYLRAGISCLHVCLLMQHAHTIAHKAGGNDTLRHAWAGLFCAMQADLGWPGAA
jgi:hypothetical protein